MYTAGLPTLGGQFGIYPTALAADVGVDALVRAGFPIRNVSVLLSDAGTLGLLASLGAIAIPGLGPFIAAGPIMSALAGVGAGGAVGGFLGALTGLGIPEYEAKRYEGQVKNGGGLGSVP